MKKLITGSLAALTLINQPVHAESISVDAMPVVLGSRCQTQIRTPGSTMGYMFSGDCKTVFVLPAAVGKVSVPSFAPTTHLMLCGELANYTKNFSKTNAQLSKLALEMAQASSDSRIRLIKSKMEGLKEYLALSKSIFENKEGAFAQLVFKNAVEQNDIDQWIIQNAEVMRANGVNFMPAALGKSVLTMSIPQAEATQEKALLRSEIPGLSLEEDNTYRHFNFKGALSGKVVLSLFGACPLISKVPESLNDVRSLKISESAMSSHLVVNQSFDVATRMQMRYDAVLKKERVIEKMNRYFQEKSKELRISEFIFRNGGANVRDLIDFELYLSELDPAQNAVWEKFQTNFNDAVLDRMTKKLTDELEALGAIEVKDMPKTAAPDPSDVDVPESRRFCSSDSLLGIQTFSSCSDRIVIVKKRTSGSSEQIDEQKLNLVASIEEHYQINQPFFYNFTSTFAPEQK